MSVTTEKPENEKVEGVIEDIEASWSSGIMTLSVRDDAGELHQLPAENASLGRALGSMFDCIESGHTIGAAAVIGQRIKVEIDRIGTIATIEEA